MTVRALRRATRNWFGCFVGFTLVIITLGLLANPYRLLPIYVTIPRINDIQPALYQFLGQVRIFDLANRDFDALLFGSSRVIYGLNPQAVPLKPYGLVYNAGLFGAQLFEIEKMFEHALTNQKNLRLVVLGLDLFAFNSAADNKPLPLIQDYNKNSRELFRKHSNLAIDLRAITNTLVTSAFQRNAKSIGLDGAGIPDPLSTPEVYPEIFSRPEQLPEALSLYFRFGVSSKSIDALRRMGDQCRTRGIQLQLFTTPTLFHYNSNEWLTFRRLDIWHAIQNIRAEIASIGPYWDFDYPNRITRDSQFFIDSGHFSRTTGELILGRMLSETVGSESAEFGVYVTEDNVQKHLARLNRMYEDNIMPAP